MFDCNVLLLLWCLEMTEKKIVATSRVQERRIFESRTAIVSSVRRIKRDISIRVALFKRMKDKGERRVEEGRQGEWKQNMNRPRRDKTNKRNQLLERK